MLVPLVLFFHVSLVFAVTYPGSFLGGGNFDNAEVGPSMDAKFAALNVVGGTKCRINLYSFVYWDDNKGEVLLSMDQALIQAHKYGVTPMVLFEYYKNVNTNPVGNYSKWYSIGYSYASRYGPNSNWAISNNLTNFGVTVYSAFNEPEGTGLPNSDYYFALLGLADGVHAVNKSWAVNPGGFKNANAARDWRLGTYGPTLAPLWNNGTLDGIDLHTYYDIRYAPIEVDYISSAQNNFDQVKLACNITKDTNFYSTEWNYKRLNNDWDAVAKAYVTEDVAAKGFLTGFWDNAGVVKRDGTGATQFSFVWNIFFTNSQDLPYGICSSLSPTWTPIARGSTLKFVQNLITGFFFTYQEPKGRGIYLLSDGGEKRMIVWQNWPYWSNITGTNFTVEGIDTKQQMLVDMYGYDGLRNTATVLLGSATYKFTNVSFGETLMFLIYPKNPGSTSSSSLSSSSTTSSPTITSSSGSSSSLSSSVSSSSSSPTSATTTSPQASGATTVAAIWCLLFALFILFM